MTGRKVLLIVDNCPAHPKRCFYSSILEGYEKGEINPEKINVLDAIHFINVDWNINLKPTTIANCFRHCKFNPRRICLSNKKLVMLKAFIN
ncbi:hypothetical protein Goshw_008511 [Gossypium schwendimanii]|uniref:DDE-1 domain-containing protein n=1 Tax=Gossypium schwendimanii TaxID=34291 RepID=A0A7J9NCX7_GOSSC|nr:hypothetical protein [Gossypium schwendimanii]